MMSLITRSLDHIPFCISHSYFLFNFCNLTFNLTTTKMRTLGEKLVRHPARCLASISLRFPTSWWIHWRTYLVSLLPPRQTGKAWSCLGLLQVWASRLGHALSQHLINQACPPLHPAFPQLEALPPHLPLQNSFVIFLLLTSSILAWTDCPSSPRPKAQQSFSGFELSFLGSPFGTFLVVTSPLIHDRKKKKVGAGRQTEATKKNLINFLPTCPSAETYSFYRVATYSRGVTRSNSSLYTKSRTQLLFETLIHWISPPFKTLPHFQLFFPCVQADEWANGTLWTLHFLSATPISLHSDPKRNCYKPIYVSLSITTKKSHLLLQSYMIL